MSKSVPQTPQTQMPASPVRMPQRSEEIAGDERHDGPSAIAAVEQAKAADRKKKTH